MQDKAVIKDIASLRFVRNAENVVFLGPPGVGKTHLAIGLGIEAIKAGFKVYFANASSLVEKLEMADNENKLGNYSATQPNLFFPSDTS